MRSSNPDITLFEDVARQDTSSKWYAIVDSAQHRVLPGALLQRGYMVRCLLGASQGSPVAQHAPHLVELGSPLEASSAWNWISLNAKSKPCLTVIATTMSFDTLSIQLAECTEVVLPVEQVGNVSVTAPITLTQPVNQTKIAANPGHCSASPLPASTRRPCSLEPS
jgi:hypothetical protein